MKKLLLISVFLLCIVEICNSQTYTIKATYIQVMGMGKEAEEGSVYVTVKIVKNLSEGTVILNIKGIELRYRILTSTRTELGKEVWVYQAIGQDNKSCQIALMKPELLKEGKEVALSIKESNGSGTAILGIVSNLKQ